MQVRKIRAHPSVRARPVLRRCIMCLVGDMWLALIKGKTRHRARQNMESIREMQTKKVF